MYIRRAGRASRPAANEYGPQGQKTVRTCAAGKRRSRDRHPDPKGEYIIYYHYRAEITSASDAVREFFSRNFFENPKNTLDTHGTV